MDLVAQTFNPFFQEAVKSQVQDKSELHSEFKASWGSLASPRLKRTQRRYGKWGERLRSLRMALGWSLSTEKDVP